MSNDQVWFRHPERCWALGSIKQLHGVQMEVRESAEFPPGVGPGGGGGGGPDGRGPSTEGTIHRIPVAETHSCDPSHTLDSDDIAAMNNMHEGPLLALLHRRYFRDAIYTFTGDILISINPYKGIPGLYTIPGEDFKDSKLPHVFTVAEKTYAMMLEETNPSKKNQSVIVSGESGAGKTEACKHIMKFLAVLSQRYMARQLSASHHIDVHGADDISPTGLADAAAAATGISPTSGGSGGAHPTSLHHSHTHNPSQAVLALRDNIEEKVLDCNPFLEAFGNAKTVRNDNSSRFGKFMKIEYEGGKILGARIRHYLLEKARVVAPQSGERNYHIFYQLARGATPEERKTLHIKDVEEYAYLTSGGMEATIVQGVDDVAEFNDVRTALTAVGIDAMIQQDLFRLISGLMHLGNVKFHEVKENEAIISNPESAQLAAELLGCKLLPKKLVRRLMKVKGRKSAYDVTLNARQGAVSRDSLAKAAYERLFSWLIDKTNRILTSKYPSSAFVGILDIFGFEIFAVNSFEQLCINYANEKLQNLFNHHIFVMEQEAYAAEGVDVTTIQFVNNQPCVDLIEKKPYGLLPMLDEICFLGRETTDTEYLDKIEKAHKGKNEYYGNPKKRTKDTFSVLHFAGEVVYAVTGFIEKNNDTLYTDLEELMLASEFNLLVQVFDDNSIQDVDAPVVAATTPVPSTPGSTKGAGGGSGGGGGEDVGHMSPALKQVKAAASKQKTQSVATIASKFKSQLGALNDTLLATTPHYVRCVKPNKLKRAHYFDHAMILAQLLYSGVLETVRIRRQGFPFRETFVEFWRRANRVGFTCLAPKTLKLPPPPPPPNYVEGADGRANDTSITAELVTQSKQGTSLLCAALLKQVEWTLGKNKVFMKDGSLDSIIKRFRIYHTTRIQSWWKMVKIRRRYRRYRRAVRKMQKCWRGILLRRKYAKSAHQVTRLQAHIRRRITQRKWKRIKAARANAGQIVKAYIRGNHEKKAFKKMILGFRTAQRCWRAKQQRRRLLKGRMYIVRLQSFARMVLVRRKYMRVRYLRQNGCAIIQAKWKAHIQQRNFKRFRNAVKLAQALYRRRLEISNRRRMFFLIVRLQAAAKRWRARTNFSRLRRKVRKIQAWWKMIRAWRGYQYARSCARRIEKSMLRLITQRALKRWVQDLHAAASWGDAAEVETILLCKRPEYVRLGLSIPNVADRVRIRNRLDGMKTVLHTAAAGGNVDAVKLLLANGAEPGALDSFGATPAHKAAAQGDSHLPVLKTLLGLFTNPIAVANHPNMAGETVLDAAVWGARNAGYGKREHDTVLTFLLSQGALPLACGLSPMQVRAMVDAPRPGLAAAASAAAREREMMERRARERREDPHYQLLFVGEAERRRKAEAATRAVIEEVDSMNHAKKAVAIKALLENLGEPASPGPLSGRGAMNSSSGSSSSGSNTNTNAPAAAAAPTGQQQKTLAQQYAEAALADLAKRGAAHANGILNRANSTLSSNSAAANAAAIATSNATQFGNSSLSAVPVRPPVLGGGTSSSALQHPQMVSVFHGSPPHSSAPTTARPMTSAPSFTSTSFGPSRAVAPPPLPSSYAQQQQQQINDSATASLFTPPPVADAAEFIAASLTSLAATGERGRRGITSITNSSGNYSSPSLTAGDHNNSNYYGSRLGTVHDDASVFGSHGGRNNNNGGGVKTRSSSSSFASPMSEGDGENESNNHMGGSPAYVVIPEGYDNTPANNERDAIAAAYAHLDLPEIDSRGNVIINPPNSSRPVSSSSQYRTRNQSTSTNAATFAASATSPSVAMPATRAGAVDAFTVPVSHPARSGGGGGGNANPLSQGGGGKGRATSPVRPTSIAELEAAPQPRSIRDHSFTPGQDLRRAAAAASSSAKSPDGFMTSASTAASFSPSSSTAASAAPYLVTGKNNSNPTMSSSVPSWTVHQSSSTGLLYYHNSKSGVTQWTEPADFDGRYTPQQLELLLAVQAGPGSKAAAVAAASGSASGQVGVALMSAAIQTSAPSAISSATTGSSASAPPLTLPASLASYSNLLYSSGRPTHPAPSSISAYTSGNNPDNSVYAAYMNGGSGSSVADTAYHTTTSTAGMTSRAYMQQQQQAPAMSSSRPQAATLPSAILRQSVPPLALVTGAANNTLHGQNNTQYSSSNSSSSTSNNSSSSSGRKALGPGRNGWNAAADASGKVYYYHSTTGKVQWQRPVEF